MAQSMVRVVSDTCTVTIWPACSRPRLTRCRQTRITPVLAARRCTVTGSLDGRGGGPARRAPRSRSTCSRVSGLGPGPQQRPGVGVEELQRRTRSGSRPAARRGSQRPAPGAVRAPTSPVRLTTRSTSIASPCSGPGYRRRARGDRAVGPQPARSATLSWDRTVLTREAARLRCTTSQSTHTRTVRPAWAGPSHSCCGPSFMFPDGGTTRSSSTASASPGRGANGPSASLAPRSPPWPRCSTGRDPSPRPGPLARPQTRPATPRPHGGQRRWQPQSRAPHAPPAATGGEPLGRGHRHLVVQRLVRPVAVVLGTHASTAACASSTRLERPRLVEELRAEGAVEPLHLPVLVRRGRRGQPMRDPVRRQILSNNTSPGPYRPNRSVNCLPLSVITSSGTPNRASACANARHTARAVARSPPPPSRRTASGHRPR